MFALNGIDWDKFLQDTQFEPLLVMFLGALVGITAIALWHWSKVRVAEAEMRLKERMVDRGFSPEEIERVLHAGATGQRKRRHLQAEVKAQA